MAYKNVDERGGRMKDAIGKCVATVGVWTAISWIMTGIDPSGGTVGWGIFFAFLTTCAIWSDGNMNIF